MRPQPYEFFGKTYVVALGAYDGNELGAANVNGEYVCPCWPCGTWDRCRRRKWLVVEEDGSSRLCWTWEDAAQTVINAYWRLQKQGRLGA